ncbi:BC_2427 family protein [Bacillus nitratireducens]|uniref:BC_2427 family protein n=1 Tax=Bacillus nitratireducens TaxID=2026193 RepID=UPI000BEC2263|nr:hypothetical protein [Bacillus nitratireducens]PEE14916.1 hypothetical protein CON53_27485 [Bacillus cereus]MED0906610.1 hypothetical protein [Bacillus nitratireducens]PES73795.1 hypothetical protein CN509_25780 [Bacillus cereus]PES97742.1 hypothetical protein CN505_28280 [Bacillus cereus]PFH89149.1 hypothetical protein COI81_12210 [Bacillus cereus]
MNRPWIGKGIWNQIYKEKNPNIQDDSCEIRKKKEGLETESEHEENELEQEDVGTELEQEEVETELEQKEVEKESEQKEVETESEQEAEIELEQKEVETELEQEENESEIKSSLRSMVMKTPFFIVSEVSSFLKFPNISMKEQEAFVFQNEKNAGCRELGAKLLTTVQYYHGKAYCKLVSSNLHEKREFLNFSNSKVEDDIEKNRIEASSWIPIHSMILEKESEGEFNDYITVKLPIEIGRYKGEISLREKVVFKEKVTEIKDVSQEIILTKNEILLPKIKKTGQNLVTVEKAGLLVEGYIYQCIEYTIEQSTSHDNVYQLMQNIVLELTIQVLQEQEVRVRM